MSTWFTLLSRELAMLALLTVVGAGPAALLHRAHDRVTRAALAPAYGLAVACGVLTTGLWRIPGDKLVVAGLLPLVVASVALVVAARRRGWSPVPERAVGVKDWVQLGVVVVVVLVALGRPMVDLGAVGPIGGYQVADAVGYVAEIDGAQEVSSRTAEGFLDPRADRGEVYWAGVSRGYQQIGYDAVQAPLNVLLGLDATDTHTANLFVLVLIAGLGVFAAVRRLTASSTWAAVAGGVLAAGPFLFTLVMDGSQGALAGLCLLVPFGLAAWTAWGSRRWLDAALAGVLFGGVMAAYPLWIPHLVLAMGFAGAWLLVRRRLLPVRTLVGGLAVLGVVAIAVAPYPFLRNVEYWRAILEGTQSYNGLPAYDVRLPVLYGWIAQTVDFYGRVQPGDALFSAWLVPFGAAFVAFVGLRRFPAARVLLALAGAGALLCLFVVYGQDCTYCGQRNLLPLAPAGMVALGVGLAALAVRHHRLVAVAAAAVLLGFVGAAQADTAARVADAAYVLDPEVKDVLDALPSPAVSVHMEGFGQGDKPKMEEPAVYHALNERVDGPPSINMFIDDFDAQAYIGGKREAGPELQLDHRYVLSRFASVAFGTRRGVRRAGPIALSERLGRYDVTVEGGIKAAMSNVDGRGLAWLAPGVPLTFFVTGGRSEPLWVRFRMREVTSITVLPGEDLDARRTGDGKDLEVCVRTSDRTGPGRLASVNLEQGEQPPPPPVPEYAPPPPSTAGYLTEVDVSTSDCSPLR